MRVLVVEDEEDVARSLARGLRETGMAVDCALDLESARGLVKAGPPYEVMVLDVMLDRNDDGLTFCRELRAGNVSGGVLMLTARDELSDRLAGFDAGADDYLVKPFFFEEALARIRALASRSRGTPPDTTVAVGNVALDPKSRIVSVGHEQVATTRKEFDLLELLMRNANHFISRDQILDVVWSGSSDAKDSLIDVYISRLRRKLSKASATVVILTERRIGYVLRAT